MTTEEYRIKVVFAKGATYNVQLNPLQHEYGELSQVIIARLQAAFIAPLPKPDHIVIKSIRRNAFITPETLEAKGLRYFLPDASLVSGDLLISIGKSWLLAIFQPRNSKTDSQIARLRLSVPLKKVARGLQGLCCFSVSQESTDFKTQLNSPPMRTTKHSIKPQQMCAELLREEYSYCFVKD